MTFKYLIVTTRIVESVSIAEGNWFSFNTMKAKSSKFEIRMSVRDGGSMLVCKVSFAHRKDEAEAESLR